MKDHQPHPALSFLGAGIGLLFSVLSQNIVVLSKEFVFSEPHRLTHALSVFSSVSYLILRGGSTHLPEWPCCSCGPATRGRLASRSPLKGLSAPRRAGAVEEESGGHRGSAGGEGFGEL